MAYEELADLGRQQGWESRNVGNTASRMADPFAPERFNYQNQLRKLMEKPGDFASSPTYKFAFDQGLDAVNRKAAASGMLGSGNRLAELTRFGQGLASQQFFPQANLLAQLSGATTGSPAAAGLAYSGAIGRGQDQESMASLARSLGRAQAPRMQSNQFGTGLPSGGSMPSQSGGFYGNFGIMPSFSGGYGSEGSYGGYGTSPTYGYGPSQDAGSGYMQSDYGTTTFGNGLPSGGGLDFISSDWGDWGSNSIPDQGFSFDSGYDSGADWGSGDTGDWGDYAAEEW